MLELVNPKVMIELSNIQSFVLNDSAREKIKYFIKKKNLSQRKIAEISNGQISYSFVAALLSGITNVITKEKLVIICEILDVAPEMIFDNSLQVYSKN